MFLIPANSKKGSLIFGIFTPKDLIIFGSGAFATMLLIFILGPDSLAKTIIILLPVAATAFLVTPLPNYHNVLNILKDIINFYSNNQKYEWKGWCFSNEQSKN